MFWKIWLSLVPEFVLEKQPHALSEVLKSNAYRSGQDKGACVVPADPIDLSSTQNTHWFAGEVTNHPLFLLVKPWGRVILGT